MNKAKRILSMLLAVMMIVMMIPFSVIATDIDTLTSSESTGTVDETTPDNSEENTEGAFVAQVGAGKTYENITDAIAAVPSDATSVTFEIYGAVELKDYTNLNPNGAKSVSIVGTDTDASLTITGSYRVRLVTNGAPLTIKNITMIDNVTGNVNAWEDTYFAPDEAIKEITCTNVIFKEGVLLTTGQTATFTNCKFDYEAANGANESHYMLFLDGDVDVTVDGCEFTNGSNRAIKICEDQYNDGKGSVGDLTVKNTTFADLSSKPAIVLTQASSITLEKNTYPSTTGVFELDVDGVPNGTTVTADITDIACKNDDYADCGVLVDGKIYTTITDAATVATSGSTVTLMYNTDEEVQLPASVTLNTNGYTAGNITYIAPTEVATFEELVAALANGGDIKLTADITTTKAITTSGITAVIDLNGKTLTIGAGDNKFNDATTLTIKNGNICITGVTVSGNAIFCLDEYEKTLVTTVTLENVNLTGNGYSSAYGVFYIGNSSILNVIGGEWNLANDTHGSGGVFKADDAKATLSVSGTKMTLHNVRRVVTYAATTIDNSTLTITGDADGVDAEMEHGFNRSPLTITNSTITMANLVGRGITAECGTVVIGDNSVVTMENCQEATIDVRASQTVTVAETATVTLDAEPTITSGTISGTVTVKAISGTVAGGFIVHADSDSYICQEISNLNATKSVVLKLYDANGTLLATTTLTNSEYFVMDVLTVKFCIVDTSSSWTTVWEEGKCHENYVPAYSTLYVDGTEMNSTEIHIWTQAEQPLNWYDVNGVEKAAATGTLKNAYTSDSKYWGECGGNAKVSFAFKFYYNDTYMGITSLNNVGGIIDGDVFVTWSIKLDAASNTDEYWDMSWEIAPTITMQPNRVEQWVDGVKVAECEIEPNSPDKLSPIVAAVTDADGKILSYVNNKENATLANGGNIVLLRDVTLSETLNIAENATVNLNLNGNTLTGSILAPNAVLTVTNGSIVNTNADVSALEINAGTLTLTDVNIDSARHAVRIDGAVTATINSGTYKSGTTTGKTRHAVNVSGAANVTINGGTFVGPKGTDADSGAAVNVQTGATVIINDGNFSGGKNATLAAAGSLTVYSGTYDQDVSAYVADGYVCVKISDGNYEVKEAVAQIGDTKYASIQDAVNAAQAGDKIVIIKDISNEAVTVDKNVTITSENKVTLNNVSITANGTDVELIVSNLKFTGTSYINANNGKALTVTDVEADVTLNKADAVTNSRAAFISLGASELTYGLKLTVEGCSIVVKGDSYPDPILGWRYIADGSSVSNNTFGSKANPNWDAVKLMNVMDGATITFAGNTVYANGNGFAFGQNCSRDNAYKVNVNNNAFFGSADYVWIEVSGAATTHATINATSDNTVNGETFTVNDIKFSSKITAMTSYAGVDVVTDDDGKVIGGTLTKLSNADVLADGYKLVENTDGSYGVAEDPTYATFGKTF